MPWNQRYTTLWSDHPNLQWSKPAGYYQSWQWVIFYDPWPTWPMSQLTRDPRDPWLTTTHQSRSQCDVCLPYGEGRKYRCDFDFILCLRPPPRCTIDLVHISQSFFPKISTQFRPSQGNLCVSKVVCSSLATLLHRLWKGTKMQTVKIAMPLLIFHEPEITWMMSTM